MPNEDNKILKYNHGEKSLKGLAVIYADLQCLFEKMYSCQNKLEKSGTEKKTKHTPSGYSLFTNFSFDATKNKLDCYKGEDCMERLFKDLRNYAMKISNSEGKEKIPLTNKENKKNKKFVTHAKKNLVLMKMIKMNLNYTIKWEIIIITLKN